jgi:hypothetical protein
VVAVRMYETHRRDQARIDPEAVALTEEMMDL